MRIAVDVSIQETPYLTGVEQVQHSLLQALAAIDQENEYLLISKKEIKLRFDLPDNFRQVAVVEEGSPYLWRERFVPPLLTREKIDVFHSPVSATPILGKAKKIATVHELPWVERDAKTQPREKVKVQHRVWLSLNVRYASRIVAVSKRTMENILSLYPDAGDKIVVIHHGIDERFKRLKELPDRGEFLSRFGIPDRPFLFYVGTLRRKKNLRTLLNVFAGLPEPERSNVILVLAGIRTPTWPEFEELVEREEHRGRVFLPGYVSDSDLVYFYNMAEALVYPSLFEGFGLPPLEAMACGTPVVTSTGGAIPEVVGESALTFPPDRPDKLEEAIMEVLRKKKTVEALRKRGRRRAQRFTWKKAAEKYLDLYQDLA